MDEKIYIRIAGKLQNALETLDQAIENAKKVKVKAKKKKKK